MLRNIFSCNLRACYRSCPGHYIMDGRCMIEILLSVYRQRLLGTCLPALQGRLHAADPPEASQRPAEGQRLAIARLVQAEHPGAILVRCANSASNVITRACEDIAGDMRDGFHVST